MATTIATGIVLSTSNFNEHDRIVTVLTENWGKFSLLARGVNKLESKNKYSLNTFNNSHFEFFKTTKTDGLSKLKTGVLIKDHNRISENYRIYEYASALNYLLLTGLEPWRSKNDLYQNFLLVLNNFNQEMEITKNFVYFLFYSLPTFGGPKRKNHCFRCGQRKTSYALYHLYDLQLICHHCRAKSETIQNNEWLNFVQLLIGNNLQLSLESFVNEQYVIILGKILLNYYRETLGLDSRILQLVNQKRIFNTITNDLINFLLQY